MVAKGSMIEFQAAGRTAKGYLAGAREGDKLPGLIVIHEWWGLNDHIKDVAGRFADEGYIVLAPDLYDGKATKDPSEAGQLMQGLDKSYALETLNGAVGYLKSRDDVDSDKIAVTGFCMGGSYSLLLACYNDRIKASAPFYGDIPSDEELQRLSAPVLFIGAENDFWITQEKMNQLKEGLAKHHKAGEVKVYSGVGHAFFNDTRTEAYDQAAAADAWSSVNQFLKQNL